MHSTVIGRSSARLHATCSLLLFLIAAAGCGGGATPEQATSSSSVGSTTAGTSSGAGGGTTSAATTGVGGGAGASSGTTGGTGGTGDSGSGGGNPCAPPFVTAKPPPICGGSHDLAPTAGVACSGQLCPLDQGCCYSIGVSCGTNSCYAHADCDGPEDCPTPGHVCCVSPTPNASVPKSSYYLGAVCVPKASCGGAGVPACNTSADCAAGESCCGTFDNYGEVDMGICHAGSCN